MTTPSPVGTTIPNGMTPLGMRPMTQVASRVAMASAGSLRSAAIAAASASNSRAASPPPAPPS